MTRSLVGGDDHKPSSYWIIDLTESNQLLYPTLVDTLSNVTGQHPNSIQLRVPRPNDVRLSFADQQSWIDFQQLQSILHANQLDQTLRALFVVVPENRSDWIKRHLSQSFYWAMSCMEVLFTDRDFLIQKEDELTTTHLLYFCERVARCRRTILLTPTSLESNIDLANWTFEVENLTSEQMVAEYVLSRIGRDTFQFGPLIQEDEIDHFVECGAASEHTLPLSIDLLESEYNDWFRQEFGSRESATSFLELCWESICKGSPCPRDKPSSRSCKNMPVSMLPWGAQMAIGVARMCRRMSTWTLEGEAFDCTVVLYPEAPADRMGIFGGRFRALINIYPTCPFNFDFEDEIREYAEIAQGTSLYLLVNALDGRLHHIATSSTINSAATRHELYSDLAGEDGLIFRIRPNARVDLYNLNGLAMQYDGFQWISKPFAKLRAAATGHFKDHPQCDTIVEIILDATQTLLDRSESSIFVLTSDDDKSSARRLTDESLRPSISWSSRKFVRIADLSPNALASLLHLDGAHSFEASGRLVSISRRIQSVRARHAVPLTRSEFEELQKINHRIPANAVLSKFAPKIRSKDRYGELIYSSRVTHRTFHKWKQEEHWLSPDVATKLFNKMNDGLVIRQAVVTRQISYGSRQEILAAATQSNMDLVFIQLDDEMAWFVAQDSSCEMTDKIEELVLDTCGPIVEDKRQFFLLSFQDSLGPGTHEKVNGLGFSEDEVWIDEAYIESVIESDFVPESLNIKIIQWIKFGPSILASAPGTGTRAAEELSMQLPNSVIVKVSSSGKLKVISNR